MGDMFKEMFSSKNKIKIIALIVLIPILFLVIPAGKQTITIEEGTYKDGDNSNTPYVVDKALEKALTGGVEGVTIDNIAIENGQYKINLDTVVDEIITTLNQNGGNLDTYLSSAKKVEYLKKMIKAELVTQYPNLGGTAPASGFQGTINFVRYKADGTSVTLTYKPLGTEGVADSTTLYGLIANNNASVLNHFSLDEEGRLVVAEYTETIEKTIAGFYETEYVKNDTVKDYRTTDATYLNSAAQTTSSEYRPKTINYKTLVSNYTMPFEYLWAFLVCGEDEEFVSGLADLVLGSQINIGIYDSVSISEGKTVDSYNANTWTRERTVTRTTPDNWKTYSEAKGEWTDPLTTTPPSVATQHHYTCTYKKISSNSITNIAVTLADVWHVRQEVTYVKEETTATDPELDDWQTTRGTNEEYDATFTGSISTYGGWSTISSTQRKGIETQKQTKNNQYSTSISENSNQCKYKVNGAPTVTPKTDKEAAENNFSKLYVKSSARNNINGAESWLFEILANNEATANMVDLTKYLLYCATGVNHGVKTYDFTSIYSLESFSSAYGGTVEAKIWLALRNAGYSAECAAGVLANIFHESGFYTNNMENSFETATRTDESYTAALDNGTYSLDSFMYDQNREKSQGIGYGLCQWTDSTRKKGLYDFWQSKVLAGEDISISDADMQIEYLLGEMTPEEEQAPNVAPYATFCLADHGSYTYEMFKNASTSGDAAEIFCAVFERPANTATRAAARRLEAVVYYEQYKDLQMGQQIPNEGNPRTDGWTGTYTSASGKTYIEYKQSWGPWAKKGYANGTMSAYGCYPTAVAILTSAYNSSITPEDARNAKFGTHDTMSATTFFSKYSIRNSDTYSGATISENDIKSHLSNGKGVMINLLESKTTIDTPYTSGKQHWIALLDMRDNNGAVEVYVSNPNPSINAPTGWRPISEVMIDLNRAIYVY